MGKISDMVMCDLRYITTAEQAQGIEEISDIVMLILPKDAPDEVMSAISAIPKHDIVTEMQISRDAMISTINGTTEINDGFFGKASESVLIINGIGIISCLKKQCSGTIILNGMLIISENSKDRIDFNYASLNGRIIYADFDAYNFHANKFVIDADYLKYAKNKTALIAGNKIIIADDVSVDMLQNKELQLIAGNKVVCRREIAGYVKTIATAGNKIALSEEEDDERD